MSFKDELNRLKNDLASKKDQLHRKQLTAEAFVLDIRKDIPPCGINFNELNTADLLVHMEELHKIVEEIKALHHDTKEIERELS